MFLNQPQLGSDDLSEWFTGSSQWCIRLRSFKFCGTDGAVASCRGCRRVPPYARYAHDNLLAAFFYAEVTSSLAVDQNFPTAFPHPPSPLTPLLSDVARRPTPAAGYTTPPPSASSSYNTPITESHQSHPSIGLEMTDLWMPASPCMCASLPTRTIRVHKLRSLVPWVRSSRIGLLPSLGSRFAL